MNVTSIEKVKKFVIGNWKMYLPYQGSIDLAEDLERKINFVGPDVRVVICPSFPPLSPIKPILKDIYLGAQDCAFEDYGAHTSQVSAKMLREIGCDYVILGHSERRKDLNETNQIINKKIKASLAEGLIPILCVGENREERDKGLAERVVIGQIDQCLKNIKLIGNQHMLIAYEPIWAIGSGQACTPDLAVQMHEMIRHHLKELFSDFIIRKRVWVIYGGSANPDNIMPLFEHESIEGVLVGGASVKAKDFFQMVEQVKKMEFLKE